MNKINIALDGPSGSGKGTTAKLLAKKLNYNFLDTGSMYRAIAYFMNINNITTSNFKKENLDCINLSFNENNEIILNEKNIETLIRTPKISQLASDFSTLKEIREFLVEKQKEIIKNKGFIAEGRDIGSCVMPQAELKIYLTASIEARALRRYKDYQEKGLNITFEEVKTQIETRDYQDKTREFSPLIKTKDAIKIDNSKLTIEKQVENIYNLAIKKIKIINLGK